MTVHFTIVSRECLQKNASNDISPYVAGSANRGMPLMTLHFTIGSRECGQKHAPNDSTFHHR